MEIGKAAPHPDLKRFVRHYHGRSGDVGAALRIALPARTQVFFEFYFTRPHLLEVQRTGAHETAPWSVAVGPQTFRRVDLILSGRIDVFTVVFTPTGVHGLFDVPMDTLADAGVDADHLLGPRVVRDLYDALAGATTLVERARIADTVLLERLRRRDRLPDTALVAAIAQRMHHVGGRGALNALVPSDSVSPRQFRRLFERQVGMAPKRYARIVRIESALAAKAADPGRSWTDIAHAFGWFDQAHLDKDFRALAGSAPSRYPLAHTVER